MSEPEIARRCTHCGVTLRQSAMFCPQCGHEIDGDDITRMGDPGAATLADIPAPAPSPAAIREPDTAVRENPPSVPRANEVHDSTGVAGNVRERVEKIRHVSSVVIDQAAYDPSLRFILVAALLFILFLVLLIVSKFIG